MEEPWANAEEPLDNYALLQTIKTSTNFFTDTLSVKKGIPGKDAFEKDYETAGLLEQHHLLRRHFISIL